MDFLNTYTLPKVKQAAVQKYQEEVCQYCAEDKELGRFGMDCALPQVNLAKVFYMLFELNLK